MLDIASPQDIQNLPDIQSWLDWMRYLEEDVLHLESQKIRRYILNAVLTDAARAGLPLTEESFAKTTMRIHPISLPDDFDVYGDRKDFYLPTIATTSYEELTRLFMTYGFFFNSSASLHMAPQLFRTERTDSLSTFVPAGIRPVTVLLAAAQGIKATVATHTGFAVDPLARERETLEPKDRFISKWVGLLNLAKAKKTERSLAEALIADRQGYHEMIYPETSKIDHGARGISEEEAVFFNGPDPENTKKLIALNKAFAGKCQEEVDAFMASPFALVLGFQPLRGELNLTERVICPLFNFLKKMVEKLGYGKALSLMMRSPSLDALIRALATEHPEIEFASTAYKDLGLMRDVIHNGGTF